MVLSEGIHIDINKKKRETRPCHVDSGMLTVDETAEGEADKNYLSAYHLIGPRNRPDTLHTSCKIYPDMS